MYLEAEGFYTLANLLNGEKIVLSKSIKLIEYIVNSNPIFRAHCSYVINVKFAKRFYRDLYSITLTNEIELPLSRMRYDGFLKSVKLI